MLDFIENEDGKVIVSGDVFDFGTGQIHYINKQLIENDIQNEMKQHNLERKEAIFTIVDRIDFDLSFGNEIHRLCEKY